MSTYYQKTIMEQLIKIDQLQGTLRALTYRDDFTGLENELLKVVTLEEKLCVEMRELIHSCGVLEAHEYDKLTQDLLGISVEKKDGGVVIMLPPLRHRDKHSENASFITVPLFKALRDFTQKENVDIFEKARIHVCHCYQSDMPISTLPDYDNIEMKRVLDIIATFFLIDDNITRCELLLSSKEAEEPHTEITVIPLSPKV